MSTEKDIARLDAKLDKEITALETKMEARFDRIDVRYERIMWSIIIILLVIQIFFQFALK